MVGWSTGNNGPALLSSKVGDHPMACSDQERRCRLFDFASIPAESSELGSLPLAPCGLTEVPSFFAQ